MKQQFNTRHFLLLVLLICFGLLLSTRYLSTPLTKVYTDIVFAMTTVLMTLVVYLFVKEINRVSRLVSKLHLQSTELRETLNSLEEGVISTDLNGIIKSLNPAAEKLTGWDRSEAVNLPLERVYNVINEKTGLQFHNIVSRILKEGKSIELENNTVLRKKGGEEIVIINSGTPMRDIEGKIIGAILVFRDMTQKKLLEEQQSLFSAIIGSSNDAIISKDFDGKILSWNDAAERIFGYTEQEAIGQSILMLLPPDRMHEEAEIIAQIRKGMPIKHFETERLRKDGSLLNVSLTISPVTKPDGTVIGISKIARDITERKQIEAKLNASEKHFRVMIEKSEDMITLAKADGTITYGSPSITKSLGYEISDFLQLSALDVIHAEDIPALMPKIDSILHTPGASFYSQHRLKHKNGNWIWVEGIMTNMLDEPGVEGLISNFRDVTERMDAERSLRENFQALSAASEIRASILDALPANIALLDKDGVIIEVNQAWGRFAKENGSSSEHANIGDNYIEIAEKATGEGEEAGKQMAEGIRNVIQGNIPLFELEYACHSPTEQRWFKAEVAPLRKEHGIGAVVMHINITERQKTQEELRHSHKLIKKLTEQLPVAVYQFEIAPDGSMSFPFINKGIERLMPDITVEAVNQDASIPFSHIHEDDLASFMLSIEESRQTLSLWKQEYRIRENDGKTRWLLASSIPEKKDDGTVVWYGYIQDIDERKSAEAVIRELNEGLEARVQARTQELTNANAALEAFSYSVSHDLRSPLRSILGFSKLIRRDYVKDLHPDAQEMFEFIESSTKRMDVIIADLLTLAKYSKERVSPSHIDLELMVSNVWKNISLSSTHNAKLVTMDLPVIEADASMLEQVLINLLSNAIKYSSKKAAPVVTVEAESADDTVTIAVTDNGAGFEMKYYDKLFGAFQRLHSPQEFEGTGVGLNIVKRIIEKHKGSVWAEGKIGEGATFYVSLPKRYSSQ